MTLLWQRGMTKYWRPVSCEKFPGEPPRSCSAKLGGDETSAHSPCFSRHAARGTSFGCFSFSARLTRQLLCDINFEHLGRAGFQGQVSGVRKDRQRSSVFGTGFRSVMGHLEI